MRRAQGDGSYYRVRETRECSGPDCDARVQSDMICCRSCWDTVPKRLQDAFYRTCCGNRGRRDAWKRIERYLAIRAGFREKAGVAS